MTILTSISPQQITVFQRAVWQFYREHRRTMPWRMHPTPYFVLASEMMLQQTRVTRVQSKFVTFVRRFPTLESLAAVSLADVLEAWTGLGYNRRAKFLWQAAQRIVRDYNGQVPRTQKELTVLPGIGQNTAGAILAYAYNEPAVFIETNIRTVYLHHFFADHANAVSDDDLRQLVAATLPLENPREWYWALMDYGTSLKNTAGSQLQRAKAYKPQGPFEGSRRQVRGQVVKALVQHRKLDRFELAALIPDDRLQEVCDALVGEGLIAQRGSAYQLTDS